MRFIAILLQYNSARNAVHFLFISMTLWTQDKTLTLINSYEEAYPLWDVSCKEYHDRGQRENALDALVANVGAPKGDIKKKIQALRTQFQQELRKDKESKRSGAGAEDVYVSKWFGFGAMQFLVDSFIPKETCSNLVVQVSEIVYIALNVLWLFKL